MILFSLVLLLSFIVFLKAWNSLNNYSCSTYFLFTISFLMILIVGFRGINVDHDYVNYEKSIYENTSIGEPTFIALSFLVKSYDLLPCSLFLFYAALGIGLKVIAIKKYSKFQLISLLIYFSNFLLLHDITQIRAGVASGILLCSFPLLMNKRLFFYTISIIIATLFHFSSIFALLLIFVTENSIDGRNRLLWGGLPVLGLMVHFLNFDLISVIPFEIVRIKLQMYKDLEEMGEEGFAQTNLFNLYFLFKLGIYYLLLLRRKTLDKYDVRFYLYLKIFCVSLFVFPALSSVTPLLGYRVGELIGIVEILLFPILFYLFKSRKQSNLMVFVYFSLLLFVNIYHKHLIFL